MNKLWLSLIHNIDKTTHLLEKEEILRINLLTQVDEDLKDISQRLQATLNRNEEKFEFSSRDTN